MAAASGFILASFLAMTVLSALYLHAAALQGLLIVILAAAALVGHAHFLLVPAGAAGLALPLYGLSKPRTPGPEITKQ